METAEAATGSCLLLSPKFLYLFSTSLNTRKSYCMLWISAKQTCWTVQNISKCHGTNTLTNGMPNDVVEETKSFECHVIVYNFRRSGGS